MYKLIRPLLFKIDSETTHNQMLALGVFLSSIGFQKMIRLLYDFEDPALESTVFGIKFKNPVGTAAGFDKEGKLLNFLPAWGFSHMHVGDISNLPFPGNPKPRLFRLVQDKALINRMGQNNPGADFISKLLTGKKFAIPAVASLVKTPDPAIVGDEAVKDFVSCFKKLYPLATMSVINISCLNTAEGKTFEEPESLKSLLGEIMKAKLAANVNKPILVKISPDVSFERLEIILQICENNRVDGYILTNTSKSREGLSASADILETIGRGGLSGGPLRQKSTELIRQAYRILKRPCIIGLGGVDSAEAAYEKIKAGASLVQLYTGLIYEGPGLVKKINQGLVEFLKRDGFKNISEAVGVEA